jgi:PhzF family phenazine biosynthesis protein
VGVPLYHVDAFADEPFTGNPAAVCLLPERTSDARWMQLVARDMNLSETAFVSPREGGFDLRWFTPAVEVKLCGHATLASAHVLWESKRLALDATARFHTLSGWLTARRVADEIELDFPARVAAEALVPEGLARALGAAPKFVGRSADDYLVEVADERTVRELKPDLASLRQLPVRGVIVTSRSSDARFDFVSRFFAPGAGVDEDPVTGSAHCALAPHWRARLKKDSMVGGQASARGGRVSVVVAGDRVLLRGRAITVARGELVNRTS